MKPVGKPMAKVSRVSFSVNAVWPWLLMRLPVLRLPKAEYR